jgi:hypothetical protein
LSSIPAAGEGALKTEQTPLVRTDFSQEAAWCEVVDAVHRDWEDGFRAMVTVIDDPAYDGWTVERLVASFAAGGHSILLVADATTMAHPERLVLCADLVESGKPFRVTLPQLWAVENNLSLANLDYEDFAGATDADGVYRGFD